MLKRILKKIDDWLLSGHKNRTKSYNDAGRAWREHASGPPPSAAPEDIKKFLSRRQPYDD